MELAILGIDGLEPTLVSEWRDDLPVLNSLIDKGALGKVRSADPPFTSPAWPDIYTGKQSGKHGVFGFTKRKPESYDRVPVNYEDVHAESLWEALDEVGISCGVANVPLSYPPSNLEHGYVVAGWPVPNRVSVSQPHELEDELTTHLGSSYKVNPYPLEVEVDQLEDDDLEDQIRSGLQHRAEAFQFLLENKDVDVFFGVFMGVDVASHNFSWDLDRLHDIYVEQDDLLGDVLELIEADADLVIMSDHGHTAKGKRSFHINEWLRRNNFLSTDDVQSSLFQRLGVTQQNYARIRSQLGLGDIHQQLPQSLVDRLKRIIPQTKSGSRGLDVDIVDWDDTRVYSPSQNRLYINDENKPKGVVQADEVQKTTEEVLDAVTAISHPADDQDGELVSDVYVGEDIYHGPFTDDAPAIVFITDEMRCNVPMAFTEGEVITDARWGEHRQYGTLITSGPSFEETTESAPNADIKDLFPLALFLADAAIPEDIDGKIPKERLSMSISPRFRKSRDQIGESSAYDSADSEAIEEQLESLGYLE